MNTTIGRRQLLQSTGASLAALALPGWAQSATYPTRAVKVVVGSAPGGPTDFMARLVADHFARAFGQGFVVDNKPGASGMPAADNVVKSTPDGYTLLVSGATAISVAPHLFPKITYDPMKSLQPLGMLGAGAYVLVVHPSVKARSLAELVQIAKAKPEGLAFGSGGIGSGSHLCTELFCRATGTKMVHVPYKGDAQAFADLMSGQVQVQFAAPNVVVGAAKDGRVRALGITSSDRLTALPDVPAIKESVADFEYLGWVGLFAPVGTPAAIVDVLAAQWARDRQEASVRGKLEGLGMNAPDRLADRNALDAFVRQDYVRMGALIRDLGITPNS
jgi:tripartite-type tricarboxylate transporter receptor subunit TctC